MSFLRISILAAACFLSGSIAALAQNELVEGNNAFALKFYAEWSKRTDENIVLSPFSLSAALGMVYPGARNATAAQMKTALQFQGNIALQNQAFNSLLTDLHAAGSPMAIANTIWMQKAFEIEASFLEANSKSFGANLRKVNFATAPDSARMAINKSIEDQTREKIKDLLPEGSINPLTRLVLANAVYFKDSWANRFDPSKTKDREFFLNPAKSVHTKFMELQDVELSYFQDEQATIVELPYNNPRFSMLIVLPEGDLSSYEASLTSTGFSAWNFTRGLFRTLQLPKFKVDHEVQPVEILRQFGMTDAFQEGQADFSGISKSRLFISGIFHKAFVEVNEEGTEAAAATAVVVQVESVPERLKELDFIANKPFLFVLRDRISNAILFIGRVNDPTGNT